MIIPQKPEKYIVIKDISQSFLGEKYNRKFDQNLDIACLVDAESELEITFGIYRHKKMRSKV